LTLDNGLAAIPERKTYAVALSLSISSHPRRLG
jgi:hypothetical protein